MTTQKIYVSIATFTIALLLGASSIVPVFAQTTGTTTGTVSGVPAGYQQYYFGTYYNSNTGMYFNPNTGQYSGIVPLGPADRNMNGMYIIPAGYSTSTFSTYYNSNTKLYYDPRNGFYSAAVPTGPVNTGGTGGVIVNPGLPNTGLGGNAVTTVALLMLTGFISLMGLTYMVSRFENKINRIF